MAITRLGGANAITGTIPNSVLAAGNVIQVVSTTKTDTFSTSSTSFTDVTGLSVSITPSSTSNKILVVSHIAIDHGDARGMLIQLVRGSTALHIGDTSSSRTRCTLGTYTDETSYNTNFFTGGFQYLDTPNTTSATTYKLQARIGSTNAGYVNRKNVDGDNANTPRTASGITLMEIAG
jgi:hypothetical protein